jgi:hypothetical protein
MLFALALCVALVGCPGGSAKKTPLPPCSKIGQQCQFEPGKLGSCVFKDGCTGANCYVCQSQH